MRIWQEIRCGWGGLAGSVAVHACARAHACRSRTSRRHTCFMLSTSTLSTARKMSPCEWSRSTGVSAVFWVRENERAGPQGSTNTHPRSRTLPRSLPVSRNRFVSLSSPTLRMPLSSAKLPGSYPATKSLWFLTSHLMPGEETQCQPIKFCSGLLRLLIA